MSIKKAIIPVAGAGTRFLPATKAMPKEMLPIIDKPIVQYVVEEIVKSGIEDIILVTGPSKRSIEDHFDYNFELQTLLKKQGKEKQRQEIKELADMANFIYIRQKGPYGNGTPILNCRDIIGNEPFVMAWGDEMFISKKKPWIKQIIETYEKYGDPVLSCCQVTDEETKIYGIVDGVEVEKNVMQIKNIVEKPGPQKASSRISTRSGNVLTPDIFDELAKTKLGKGGELWLVDAMFKLLKKRPFYGRVIDGEIVDAGSKFGWIKANIDMALERDDLKSEVRKYLKKKVK